jgi:5-methylcytosine-specific restriction protein B
MPALALATWFLKRPDEWGGAIPGDWASAQELIDRFLAEFNINASERRLFDTEIPADFSTDWLVGSISAQSAKEICAAHAVNRHVLQTPGEGEVGPQTAEAIQRVVQALGDFGDKSIIALAGVPGTGKSHVAALAAVEFASDPSLVRAIQFSPAMSYEEFIEGPRLSGQGIAYEPGAFLEWNEEAHAHPDDSYVLLIEEFTRADLPRVLGELLTFVEYREREFTTIYDRSTLRTIASNLVLLVTFNPSDRSAIQLDDALIRRLRIIPFPPSTEMLEEMLSQREVGSEVTSALAELFSACRGAAPADFDDLMPFGHGVFAEVRGEEDLYSLWQDRLRFLIRRPGGQLHPLADVIREHYPWAVSPDFRIGDAEGGGDIS